MTSGPASEVSADHQYHVKILIPVLWLMKSQLTHLSLVNGPKVQNVSFLFLNLPSIL